MTFTAAALLILVLFKNELLPEYSPAHRGLMLAQESGCFNCHLQLDGTGSINPVKAGLADQVPDLFSDRHEIDWIRQWVKLGASDPERRQAEDGNKHHEALRMPDFGRQLSDSQIDDLVSFVALGQYGRGASRLEGLPEGERIARRLACYTCHGELGQGGVSNKGSLKGYIPGFFGEDFRALTRNGNRQDIREFILDGHSQHLWHLGFAGLHPGRFFTERQAIQMPAFRDLLSEGELELLTDHLIELMNRGPLDAESLVAFRPLRKDSIDREEQGVDRQRREDGLPRMDQMPLTFLAAQTILEQHCVRCHGPERQRSGFRLDRRVLALRGGEVAQATGTAAIKPGAARESLLIRFVTATEENPFEDIYPMPPGRNPRLTPSEIEILRRWIDDGLIWPDGVQLRPRMEQSERNH